MRHSTLEMTDRYTRPRAVDIEAAASKLPSLKPEPDRPEALAATGTDPAGTPISKRFAHHLPTGGDVSGGFPMLPDVMAGSDSHPTMEGESLENKASGASGCVLMPADTSDPGARKIEAARKSIPAAFLLAPTTRRGSGLSLPTLGIDRRAA
jgi:hypothetical protein